MYVYDGEIMQDQNTMLYSQTDQDVVNTTPEADTVDMSAIPRVPVDVKEEFEDFEDVEDVEEYEEFDIETGQQFQFDGLGKKHLNSTFDDKGNIVGASICVGSILDGEEFVFRQFTRTGLISKNESKSFILKKQDVFKFGTLLDDDDLIYQTLPDNSEGMLKMIDRETIHVSNRRLQHVLEALAHQRERAEQVIEEQKSLIKTFDKYTDMYTQALEE